MFTKKLKAKSRGARATWRPVLEQLESRQLLSVSVASTFNVNGEGWMTYGDARPNPLHWYAKGGNPGGYLSATDILDGRAFYWRAPAKFHGDFSGAYSHYLTFDLKQNTLQSQFNGNDVVLVGKGITLVLDTPRNPGLGWTHYSVRLDEAGGWRKNSLAGPRPTKAEMRAVLSSISDLFIRAEYSGAADVDGLDNVILGSVASAIQVQSLASLPLGQRTAGHEGQAAIDVTGNATNYSGPVTVEVYQSSTAGAPPTAAALVPTLTGTKTGSGKAVVYLSAPPLVGMTTKFLRARAKGTVPVSPVEALAVQ